MAKTVRTDCEQEGVLVFGGNERGQNLEYRHLKTTTHMKNEGREENDTHILKIQCRNKVCEVKQMQLASLIKEVVIEHSDRLDIWWKQCRVLKYKLQLSQCQK